MKLKNSGQSEDQLDALDVVGTLPTSYHDLDMLMQSVTLCDQMTMEEAPQLSLYVRAQGRAFVPADGNPRAEGGGGAASRDRLHARRAHHAQKIHPRRGRHGRRQQRRGGGARRAEPPVGAGALSADRRRNRPDRRRGRAFLHSRAACSERRAWAAAPLAMKSRCIWWRFSPAGGCLPRTSSPRCTRTASAGDRPDNEAAQRALVAGDRSSRRGVCYVEQLRRCARPTALPPRESGGRRVMTAFSGFRRVHARGRMPARGGSAGGGISDLPDDAHGCARRRHRGRSVKKRQKASIRKRNRYNFTAVGRPLLYQPREAEE